MADPPWKKQTNTPAPVFNLGPPVKRGEKIIIYGPGGAGKTILACLIERINGAVGFVDLDDSLGVLADQFADLGLSPQSIGGVKDWKVLIAALESPAFNVVNTVVVDTATEAQNMAIAETLVRNPNTENGQIATSLESYGFGKGYRYLQDTWLDLRYALTAHAEQGRNVILVCHDFVAKVPNPDGADYIRYEPSLYQDNSISLRRMMRDWADHMFYVGYDVVANEAKKGQKHAKATGSGTRRIYPNETATCMAKTRALLDQMPYEYGDDALWRALFKPKTEGESNV